MENNEFNPKIEKKALTGFILGVIAIIAWFIPLIGFPVTITGLVFSINGMKANQRKGMATTGLVLNIIFLVITAINSILGAIMMLSLL